jgi:hypothetical protein
MILSQNGFISIKVILYTLKKNYNASSMGPRGFKKVRRIKKVYWRFEPAPFENNLFRQITHHAIPAQCLGDCAGNISKNLLAKLITQVHRCIRARNPTMLK